MVIRLHTKYGIKILKVSTRIRKLKESVNESYILQCIINTSSASPKRYLKTAGLCGIALFLDVGYLIHGHQTAYELLN